MLVITGFVYCTYSELISFFIASNDNLIRKKLNRRKLKVISIIAADVRKIVRFCSYVIFLYFFDEHGSMPTSFRLSIIANY